MNDAVGCGCEHGLGFRLRRGWYNGDWHWIWDLVLGRFLGGVVICFFVSAGFLGGVGVSWWVCELEVLTTF